MAQLTSAQMESWIQKVMGNADNSPQLPLPAFLNGIPGLDSLADVPSGTVVLVRGDVDAKPGATVGEGDIRLRSMVETLEFGRSKGWIQVIFGHIGRKPEGSLSKVAARFGDLLGVPVTLISDWQCEETGHLLESAVKQIRSAAPGSVFVLENTRKYSLEVALWKCKPEGVAALAPKFANLANDFAALTPVYVNEAFSAGSMDASTVIVPATMERVALGKYVEGQFRGPLMKCMDAELVVSSGLKMDKLDDLTAMIARGKIRWVFLAGALAMGVKKAAYQVDGKDFCIGEAEDSAKSAEPWYVQPDRLEQAKQIIIEGRAKGIQFFMPVDHVVTDGTAKETLESTDQTFDVGPKTLEYYHEQIGKFIESVQGRRAVAFHNGVFGMFEDPRYEAGTKGFMPELKRMKDAGIEVYVGGGEGGKAVGKYGDESWVTHNFTAGGTVLNALGADPVPYLVSLWMANEGNAPTRCGCSCGCR